MIFPETDGLSRFVQASKRSQSKSSVLPDGFQVELKFDLTLEGTKISIGPTCATRSVLVRVLVGFFAWPPFVYAAAVQPIGFEYL